MRLLPLYQKYFEENLSPAQWGLLQLLIWLLQTQKQVRIERLASCLPLPILYESRRKKVRRFLVLPTLSVSLLWFPLIKLIVKQEFKDGTRLIMVLDRTQWKSRNVFMISVVWRNRALPVYWIILEKKGSSNLAEQKALIRPILKLFSDYKLVILGDREFHGVALSCWLKQQAHRRRQELGFAFRIKERTHISTEKKPFQLLSSLPITPGEKRLISQCSLTKQKGFGTFNLVIYQKRKYKENEEKDPWFILTNLADPLEVIKLYKKRNGIEAMFRDCKSGGYNLEDSKASIHRLTSLILLIAIAYIHSCLEGKYFKNQGLQKYIARLREARRKDRRHSDFWVGVYGNLWVLAWDFCRDIVEKLIGLSSHKLSCYQQGFQALTNLT